MKEVLKSFTHKSLYAACRDMLNNLQISFNSVTRQPLPFRSLYRNELSQALSEVVDKVEATYYIGNIDEDTLSGTGEAMSIEDVESATSEGKYESMMVFAVDLAIGNTLTRSQCATLTRGFNRIAAAQPVILFVREGDKLTLATCERMEYSQEWRRGVGEKLGKVSMLKGIDCSNPHRGHIDILKSLGDKSYPSFDELYKHWMNVFSAQPLTKGFYDDLFEWYQWAVAPESKVSFPGDVSTQDDDREDIDTRVIRLIMRLMFVWFIKQKGLVPDCIFDVDYLNSILKDFDPQSVTETNYYQAILQNLFFGTLNRAIIEDGERREFAKASKSDVKNLYRYEELFSISEDDVIELFSTVPFLNCGLFECQDKSKTLDGVKRRYYNDGFSRNALRWNDGTYKYRATVPNVLFFHPEKGIVSIFNRYVFTIEENTPQDVQVALDPELLGKVFENLLGAYNPETKETARNQSGSFYTPREIVQYMVNESLVAHLKRTVDDKMEGKFRQLLDFTTPEVELSDEQKHQIVHALFTCKILDPACGSGAFPMGMLQQMVHVLRQVDPDNEQWREVLLDMASEDSRRAFGIADEEERNKKLDEIRDTFNNALNSPDYTRKLYIIESCIYGVDILPIAMLITRLRFFITLICEQNEIMRDKPEENFGIKTLPNLESKFVAANSLISADIHKYNNDWTQDSVLAILKDELMAIRRRHFYTRKRSEKIRLLRADEKKREQIHEHINKLVGEPNEKRIEELRGIIADKEVELENYQGELWREETVQTDLFSAPKIIQVDVNKVRRDEINATIANCRRDIDRELSKSVPKGFEAAVLQVTDWNPYDQNTVSPFLDIEWMFGVSDGFDIVIGNPPYIQLQADRGKLAKLYEHCGYQSFNGTGDIYCLFYERGCILLKKHGILIYITSNKWMRQDYGINLREYFYNHTNPLKLIDFGETHVFESACVMTNILMVANENNGKNIMATIMGDDFCAPGKIKEYVESKQLQCHFEKNETWVVLSDEARKIKKNVETLGCPLRVQNVKINYGIKSGYDTAYFINKEQYDSIIAMCSSGDEIMRTRRIIRPMLRGRNIKKYGVDWANIWMINFHNGVKGKLSPLRIEDYPAIKVHLDKYFERLSRRSDKGDSPYNLRNCAYVQAFDSPKIIYPETTKFMPFYYDEEGYLTGKTCFIMSGEHLSFLTAFFNSSLFKYCFRDDFGTLFGGARSLSKVFFEKIPVMQVDDATDAEFHELVIDIQNDYSDEKAKAIDQKIFDLYGLTQEERDIIGYIDFHNNLEDN